jgi:excisionase family DNA binding protein
MTPSVLHRELLTIPETASKLRVSEKTVRRLVSAGIMPAVRVSAGAIRIEAAELNGWLEERRTSSDVSESSGTPRPVTPDERDGTSGRREAVEPAQLAGNSNERR